jgi:hypothetical protein
MILNGELPNHIEDFASVAAMLERKAVRYF